MLKSISGLLKVLMGRGRGRGRGRIRKKKKKKVQGERNKIDFWNKLNEVSENRGGVMRLRKREIFTYKDKNKLQY